MLGRGLDQILPFPGDPRIFESFLKSSKRYVELAEQQSGPVPSSVSFEYVWGDLLADLDARQCDLRMINLETAITASDTPAAKEINYRMSPRNVGALRAAGIDVCTLANNHVLDWEAAGLEETLATLDRARIGHVGAGRSKTEAAAPLAFDIPGKGRVIVIAFGDVSSGVPTHWQAGPDRPGVNLLPGRAAETVDMVKTLVSPIRKKGEPLVLSVHWGGNWGYTVPHEQRALAHALVDQAGVDLVFGHSSHHPKGIEIYRGKLIVYGAGDLINDYEGISGYETYRGDLGLAYLIDLDPASGALAGLELIPYRRRALSLIRASEEEAAWLAAMLRRESDLDGARISQSREGCLRFRLA